MANTLIQLSQVYDTSTSLFNTPGVFSKTILLHATAVQHAVQLAPPLVDPGS